jgi:RimJ/RimL family protein N-acetyltransferase
MTRGRFANLRPVERRDLARILEIRADPAVRERIMADGPLETPEQHRAWFDGLGGRADQRVFTVAHPDTDEPLGVAGLYDIAPSQGVARWGFYLADGAARLSGVAVEAELLLLDHAFGALGLRRLWCSVLASNAQVVSLHRRFGFVVEGTLRQHRRTRGGDDDVVVLGLLRDEFATARIAVERTLAALAER